MTPSGQTLTQDTRPSASAVQELNQHLVVGGVGALISLGLGTIGILFWPHTPRSRVRRHEHSFSTYDNVTGLPTQRLFLVLLNQALSRAAHTRRIVAVLVVELEQFRLLSTSGAIPNVTLVVRVQAARIKSVLQSHDAVARLGERRFAVILDNLDSAECAMAVAQKIQRTMSLPLLVEGHELLLSCRIGGAVSPYDGTEGDALLDAASQILSRSQTDDASIKFLSDPTALPSFGQTLSRSTLAAESRRHSSLAPNR